MYRSALTYEKQHIIYIGATCIICRHAQPSPFYDQRCFFDAPQQPQMCQQAAPVIVVDVMYFVANRTRCERVSADLRTNCTMPPNNRFTFKCTSGVWRHCAIWSQVSADSLTARSIGYEVHHINHNHGCSLLANLRVLTVREHQRITADHRRAMAERGGK